MLGPPAPVLSLPLSQTSVEVPAKKEPSDKSEAPDKSDDASTANYVEPASISANPQGTISTKLAVPPTDTGELIAASYGRRRRSVLVVAACVAAVAAGALYLSSGSRRSAPDAPVSATPAPASPVTAAPAAPQAPAPSLPAEPAAPPPPPAPSAAAEPIPAPRALISKTARGAAVRTPTRKHATPKGKRPSIDQNGIGIPLD